jgi:uncharacterized protein (DUF1684 family)
MMKAAHVLLILELPFASLGQTRPTPAAHAQRVAEFQQKLNHEFRDPAESPLSATERAAFQSLPFFPVEYRYCVVAKLVRDSTSLPFAMPTSTARLPMYRKYGELLFTLNEQPMRLAVYQSKDLMRKPGLTDYIFVPFTDLSNGHGSYSGGRYIDLRIPPAGTSSMMLDFNQAYNPSCAYNHAYSCPIPPPENRLTVAIPAGVRSDH